MAKSRRPRGSGCYDKITDENGNVQFYRWRIGIYNPLDQKTQYKSIKARTRAALDKKVTAWKEENTADGTLPPLPKRLTVQQWAEMWLQTIEGKNAKGTFLQYKLTVTNHIVPNFGKLWIGKVSPLVLQQYFDGLLKNLAPTTVTTIRAHFRACFENAVRLGVIAKNPVKATTAPKARKPELKILEEDEVARILAVAKSGEYLRRPPKDESAIFNLKRNYLIVLLAVASGMRQGEVLGLTWPCIDGVTIEVKHSLQNIPGNRVLKEPKNGESRVIAIPKNVARELEAWHEFQAEYAEKFKGFYENPLSLVFTKTDGGYVNAWNFRHWDFHAILATAGLSGTRFHDLRHFFASSALAKGVSIMAVSEQLGHSSISITLERYTHVLQKSRDEMRAMLDENPLFNMI